MNVSHGYLLLLTDQTLAFKLANGCDSWLPTLEFSSCATVNAQMYGRLSVISTTTAFVSIEILITNARFSVVGTRQQLMACSEKQISKVSKSLLMRLGNRFTKLSLAQARSGYCST